ncbi:hypothetical protein SADUNF_Sadunf19G0088200 [Salix dunnii]|uniref:Uncharacterized protein n=1 Tax=Salix dunnii TaxID=1413687 RepID=A0A835MFG9_9ROSI|nr:hypothetical protein SADUNF_Sadunf19G0088200 [Salix dunnii]
MLGNGGKLTFGRLGMVGKLGSGGNVGLGRDGWVVGKVGMVGKGGNVGLGIFAGTDGRGGNWRSWRAARATLMPEKTKAMEKAMMKNLKEAITSRFYCNSKFISPSQPSAISKFQM